MNGSFVDLETGLVQGVPPHSDEEDWELQDLSPNEEEVDARSGSLSPSTEGSSAGLDSIWTLESDGGTSATTVRQTDVDDDELTIRGKRR
jgi:hypothetical protein